MTSSLKNQIQEKLDAKNLSDSTKKLYLNTSMRILNRLGVRKLGDISKFEKILIKEVDSYSPQTKKTIFSVFSILMPKSFEIQKLRSEAMTTVSDTYASRKLSEKQQAGKINVDQVKERKQEHLDAVKSRPNLHNITDYLIVALMCGATENLVPRRLEMTLTKIANFDTKKDNYYIASEYKFVFNEFKTNRHFDQQTVTIPESEHELRDIIDVYMSEFSPREFFFIKNYKNSPFSKSDMSKRMKNIFQKYAENPEGSITINDIRLAYVNHVHATKNVIESEKIAKDMGHSFRTSTDYYRKEN